MSLTKFGLTAIFAGSIFLSSTAGAGVTDKDILNDQATPKDIVSYGMGPRAQRFSPLKMLNKKNIDRLVPAYAFSYGGEKQRGQEAQPLVYDGTIYVTASYSRVFAIDARTGEEKWEYNARLPDGILPCCDVVNRGAAIYGDMIYFGTLDAAFTSVRLMRRWWRSTGIPARSSGKRTARSSGKRNWATTRRVTR